MSMALVRRADTKVLLEELRCALSIQAVELDGRVVTERQLAGIALAVEIERATERAIFSHARARYFARPDGSLDSSDTAMVEFDHRQYEEGEYIGHLRLARTYMGMLPFYVLQAHTDVVGLPHFRFARVA
ncbi:MAG: hypothetical protein KBE09_05655 [Candidatus Pacebacteria bacterium]|nr:hypothetical protein [Candidatus Paceibacterota bacterium]